MTPASDIGLREGAPIIGLFRRTPLSLCILAACGCLFAHAVAFPMFWADLIGVLAASAPLRYVELLHVVYELFAPTFIGALPAAASVMFSLRRGERINLPIAAGICCVYGLMIFVAERIMGGRLL
jgi:hypothetical protein